MKPHEKAIAFIERLTLVGDWSDEPFRLLPWQKDLIREVLGDIGPDGLRVTREAFCMLPRGAGKTTLISALCLFFLLCEGKRGQIIASCASDKRQASIIFRTMQQMIEADPELSKLVENETIQINKTHRIISFVPLHNYYESLASDGFRQHGANPSVCIYDELHAAQSADLWEAVTSSQGKRREPLTIVITTAGKFDPEHICYRQYQYAKAIQDGTTKNPEYKAFVYEASPEDDYTDPKTWAKANPTVAYYLEHKGEAASQLGKSLFRELQSKCDKAKELPSELSSFLQLYLNIWVQQAIRWLPIDRWEACGGNVDPEELKGVPCVAGMDLAPVKDLTALSLVFQEEGKYKVLPFVWCPEGDIDQRSDRDKVPYRSWKEAGFLRTFEGNTTDYDQLIADVLQIAKDYNISQLAIDPQHAAQFGQRLQNEGLPVIWHRQGYGDMSPACRHLEKLLIDGKIEHGNHPILSWAARNCAIERKDQLIRPVKEKSTERIDPLVATLFALSLTLQVEAEFVSGYETGEGVFWLG